ncbi:GNAT family N-acetyltransferase [Natronoglycomyces albus]|uniref:GNAT family N-acetyltransferase n=1 Tax=Natronoglycomyces albus TaxID=2811108 RepID=A0A895XNV3_9ACTN|nr:GNAT family protein [Natronoglycomyces albus]QSB05223.1 GNAT family N-acetyltransferase [Natronoglycomyces albus]
MHVKLIPLQVRGSDRSAFVDFLSGEEFPFHVRTNPSRELVEGNIDQGVYDDEDHAPYWVEHVEKGRIGTVALEDLTDDTPLFDLRLAAKFRGSGLGLEAVKAITAHVFSTMPTVNRLEGQTREDNIAMRKTFLRAGFLKEAHYRQSWPVENGAPLASVAYAILRRDWETGTTTTFAWEDLAA